MQSIRLERFKLTLLSRLNKDLLGEPYAAEIVAEDCSDQVVIKLTKPVWGHTLGVSELKYPASWWDALKEKLGLPAKYKRFKIDVRAIYPKMAFASEDRILTYALSELDDRVFKLERPPKVGDVYSIEGKITHVMSIIDHRMIVYKQWSGKMNDWFYKLESLSRFESREKEEVSFNEPDQAVQKRD